MGFDALGLSNNHVLDRGPEGLADTLEQLHAAGIQPFGAGRDGDEAAAPLLIRTPHGAIAVLGFGEAWRQGAVAGPGRAGTVPFSDENIARGAEAARAAGAQWIVGFVQWGANYGAVLPRQRERAAAFARARYTLVIGHHPHVVQEVDVIDGMPVLYSIGNFVFGTEGRFTARARGYGLVVRTSFGAEGLHEIQLRCVLTDNDVVRFQPRPCDEAAARSLIRSLGPHTSWSGGAGRVAR
jgi:poly-gamma-glutamate capsule biosynthesis protein CapA/YwtB (metallophosphatase superfamily)